MADDTCACRHCRIRRAAFGPGHDITEAGFEEGLAALASVFGTSIADASPMVAIGAVGLFTQTQNGVREQQEKKRAADGDLMVMEVAGHG